MKDLNKKFFHCLLKSYFKLVFNKDHCEYLMTHMMNITSNISWSKYLRPAFDNLKENDYRFSHIAEMDIILLAHKRDMTCNFYLKQKMPPVEWKLNKFPGNLRHPINTKINCYRNNNI